MFNGVYMILNVQCKSIYNMSTDEKSVRKTMEVNPKHSIMVELKKKVGWRCMAL